METNQKKSQETTQNLHRGSSLASKTEIKEPEWCPACNHSLLTDENGTCQKCKEIANEKASIEKDIVRHQSELKAQTTAKLGGERAYLNYTEDKFVDKHTLERCKEYPKLNLYIYGPTGSGKTHLACALIRKTYPKFVKVKPMQIFRKMRQCQSALEEEDVLDTLCRYNLLIDDFGVEKMTDFAFQTIYEIIDRRYEMGKGGLIITSNLDPDGLAHKFGCDRISSRIAEMCKVVKLEGKDRRIK